MTIVKRHTIQLLPADETVQPIGRAALVQYRWNTSARFFDASITTVPITPIATSTHRTRSPPPTNQSTKSASGIARLGINVISGPNAELVAALTRLEGNPSDSLQQNGS